MSRAGEALDAMGLAATGAVVERDIPIAGFARLADRLADARGHAQLRIAFGMEGGVAIGDLRVQATAELSCQRCFGAVRRTLQSESRVAFVPDEDAPVPEGREAFACDPHRLDPAALAEDELLLALPLVALHAADEDCAGRVATGDREAEAPATRRPFAGLKDLLEH